MAKRKKRSGDKAPPMRGELGDVTVRSPPLVFPDMDDPDLDDPIQAPPPPTPRGVESRATKLRLHPSLEHDLEDAHTVHVDETKFEEIALEAARSTIEANEAERARLSARIAELDAETAQARTIIANIGAKRPRDEPA